MTQRTNKPREVIRVQRFRQRKDECAIAAVATLANYYDPLMSYRDIRRLVSVKDRKSGLDAAQQGMLLNQLGFTKITIVSYDLLVFDYGWNRYTNKGIVSRLSKLHRLLVARGETEYAKLARHYIAWLGASACENHLKIDNDLAYYVKRYIRLQRPIGAIMNHTSMYKDSKGSIATGGDIRNYAKYHAVVIRGYDADNVFLVDSDSYRNASGFYKMKWSKFLTTATELLLVS
jgi:hypothetical protein